MSVIPIAYVDRLVVGEQSVESKEYFNTGWELQSASDSKQAVAWSPTLGIFASVGPFDGTTAAATSADGITWTEQTTPTDGWRGITWSPEQAIFCAVGDNGVMTSADGITWGLVHTWAAASSKYYEVVWSSTLGFCAVGGAPVGGQIATSATGSTWAVVETSATVGQWSSVTWSPSLSRFCAVSNIGGAADRVITSDNGVLWTLRLTSTLDNLWLSVAWSPLLTLFCAIGTAASDTAIMTSPDGITWTNRSYPAPVAYDQWQSIAWSPDQAIFCVVGYSNFVAQPHIAKAMISTDGITWVQEVVPSDDIYWQSMAWSPSLNIFCATGSSRVMLRGGFTPLYSNISIDTGLTLNGNPLVLPHLTTVSRDALTSEPGMLIYNTTDDAMQYYNGGWVSV